MMSSRQQQHRATSGIDNDAALASPNHSQLIAPLPNGIHNYEYDIKLAAYLRKKAVNEIRAKRRLYQEEYLQKQQKQRLISFLTSINDKPIRLVDQETGETCELTPMRFSIFEGLSASSIPMQLLGLVTSMFTRSSQQQAPTGMSRVGGSVFESDEFMRSLLEAELAGPAETGSEAEESAETAEGEQEQLEDDDLQYEDEEGAAESEEGAEGSDENPEAPQAEEDAEEAQEEDTS